LFELVSRKDIGALLKELNYDWARNVLDPDATIARELRKHGFLEERGADTGVNRMGLLFLGRLLLHFDPEHLGAEIFGSLNEKYKDFHVISAGKNSIVVLARHRVLDSKVVLKLVRPGASADIAAAMARLSQLRPDTAIVLPIDFVNVRTKDVLGKPVLIDCLMFPFVHGITFKQFLVQRNHHLNSQVVVSFARQVADALRELEKINAYHGDLHEENILVDQYASDGIRFKIVDISFGAMGSLPLEVCRNNDLASFKQHLWRILSVQKSFMPSMSLRKYIGTRNYLRIMKALSPDATTFAEVCHALGSDAEYKVYLSEKQNFITEHFESPVSFRLQRYEEITDQTIAVRLFVPFEPLMDKISDFSNIYVSGNRGSGKSTYLASLAFFPHADSSVVEASKIFGVYFPCRQGEFRPLGSRLGWDAETERRVITSVLVIKIIRRTLETLGAGVNAGKLVYPPGLHQLRNFIATFVAPPGIVSVERDIQTELDNFVATMVRVEMEEVARLSNSGLPETKARDGRAMLEFFEILRATFGELASTRFHLLFDDAGTPYVPKNVQRIICDLMLTSNAIFCVKLSAEKLTYEFQSSDGKVLENGQDYFEHDISQILFIGPGPGGLNPVVLEQYFRRIVEQRLTYFQYKSISITDYLGDNQLSPDRLLKLLALGRKDAHYCGWTTVWNIADRTPRNLLEIVSEVFSVGNIDNTTPPRVVPKRDQNRAIRTISEKRLDSLSEISGSVTIGGKDVSLGRHLFVTTAAIGSTFRKYLKSEATRTRPRQHLAIERNDIGELTSEAEEVLRRLITFGVLDASRAGYARDDEVKKPFYVLNRIYCPAFAIGYRRDDHLRLSKGKLELLLLDPQRFIREGTKRLRSERSTSSLDLFEYGQE
jgi:serine/threonine protein kinase